MSAIIFKFNFICKLEYSLDFYWKFLVNPFFYIETINSASKFEERNCLWETLYIKSKNEISVKIFDYRLLKNIPKMTQIVFTCFFEFRWSSPLDVSHEEEKTKPVDHIPCKEFRRFLSLLAGPKVKDLFSFFPKHHCLLKRKN